MALKYIELDDGTIRDVNSVEQSYRLFVSYRSQSSKQAEYIDWDEAAAAYREAISNPEVSYVDLTVYKVEFSLDGEDFKDLEQQ